MSRMSDLENGIADLAMRREMTRRRVLQRSMQLGIGSLVAGALLAACGGDDDDAPEATTAATTGGAATTTGASTSTTTSGTTTGGSSSGAASPQGSGGGEAKKGGTLTYIMPAEPDTLDPHVASSRYDTQVIYQICDSMMFYDDDRNLVPGLATDWEVGSDGLTYTLNLRDDVTFHDDAPFNAEAVVANLDRIVDPATKSEGARFSIGPYESSRAVDEFTLEVTTDSPYGPMIGALGTLYLISPAAIEKFGQDLYNNPVGTGPFVFKEWVPKSHITLTPNANYNWAPSIYEHNGPPHVDELVIKFIVEDATRAASLEAGEADLILVVPANQIEQFDSNDSFKIEKTLVAGVSPHLALNNEKAPTDDIKFRQALEYAIDNVQLNEIINYGFWEIETGPLSSASPMFEPKATKNNMYPYDADQANALLDELGWVMDGDVRKKDGEELKLVYLTLPGVANVAEAVQLMLAEFGITVEIIAEDNPAQQHDAQQGIQHIVWMQWSGIDPALMRTVFHSENVGTGWNFSHLKNAEIDQLLEEQGEETDAAARAETFSQIQVKIMEEAAIIPNWPLNRIWGMGSYVNGFAVHPGGETLVAYDLWLDK